ncbi:hypothetical protein D9M68_100140 [compost metagenome]
MSGLKAICEAQREWAAANGVGLDDGYADYVRSLELNLWRPLSAPALAAFRAGGGGELSDRRSRSGKLIPAKIRALRSSAALAANLFDNWPEGDLVDLGHAMGLRGEPGSIAFEAQMPTGLERCANLDVLFSMPGDQVVGVESKFTEWLSPKDVGPGGAFRPAYFEGGRRRWEEVGLLRAQALAADMQEGRIAFRRCGAAQLLKHALALARNHGDRWNLRYIYYDWPNAEGQEHRDEVFRFADLVGEELCFEALSYQTVFERLRAAGKGEDGRLTYLGERYFPMRS